jgi:hypothetical protein
MFTKIALAAIVDPAIPLQVGLQLPLITIYPSSNWMVSILTSPAQSVMKTKFSREPPLTAIPAILQKMRTKPDLAQIADPAIRRRGGHRQLSITTCRYLN